MLLEVPRTDLELVKAIEQGLPTEAVEAVVENELLSWADVERYILPRRTFSHRKQRRQVLTSDESDRLVRLLRVIAHAEETFQNAEKTSRWLRKPNRALSGTRPIDLLKTDSGARLVEAVLDRIAYGVYS